MIKLDFQSRTPIYLQLEKGICELLVLGHLEENEPLPSVRSLAKELGINPNTIQKAYQELESSGVIYSAQGKGSFAADPDKARDILFKSCKEKLQTALREAKTAGMPIQDIYRLADSAYM